MLPICKTIIHRIAPLRVAGVQAEAGSTARLLHAPTPNVPPQNLIPEPHILQLSDNGPTNLYLLIQCLHAIFCSRAANFYICFEANLSGVSTDQRTGILFPVHPTLPKTGHFQTRSLGHPKQRLSSITTSLTPGPRLEPMGSRPPPKHHLSPSRRPSNDHQAHIARRSTRLMTPNFMSTTSFQTICHCLR